eukprot:9685273-Alexandrium_andersonii.AAC.1
MHWCNRANEFEIGGGGKAAHQALPRGEHPSLQVIHESRVSNGFSDSDSEAEPFDPLSFPSHGCVDDGSDDAAAG